MTKPRIALFGAGSMGRNHARIISASPNATLSYVVDPFEKNGQDVANATGAQWKPSYEDVLPHVDAAVIAASTEYHYEIAKAVLDAGVPVLVEKPICPSLQQTIEILELSAAKDVPIQCGFLERFNPGVTAALSLVEEPLYVRAERHSPYWSRIKTGVAWDMLVHDADLLALFFSHRLPTSVTSELGFFHPESVAGAEDIVELALRFEGGGIGSASASRIGQRKVRKLTVQSLDSMIEIDLLVRSVTKYRHTSFDSVEGHVGFKQVTEIEVPEVSGPEPLAGQFEHFLRVVSGAADSAVERASILPAHQIIEMALSNS
ncbi:MAG: Gfo/Idh/MocA family protein [Microbacteriaceae bacterium]